MKVSYNGFTGELVKLERDFNIINCRKYILVIRDGEKAANISFDRVNIEDVKFIGGAVSFGG